MEQSDALLKAGPEQCFKAGSSACGQLLDQVLGELQPFGTSTALQSLADFVSVLRDAHLEEDTLMEDINNLKICPGLTRVIKVILLHFCHLLNCSCIHVAVEFRWVKFVFLRISLGP